MNTISPPIPGATARRPHVLLISPLTFDYHEVICDTLRGMGWDVTWWNERAGHGTLYKIMLRLLPALTRRGSEQYFLSRLALLDAAAITHVLVIKGEGLTPKVVQRMRESLSGASMGYYLWDGLENVPNAAALAGHFDCVASFDPHDARQHGWAYRPLFAKHTVPPAAAQTGYRYDWSFIGTIHSDRYQVVKRVRDRMHDTTRSFVFGFFPSRLQALVKRALTPAMWGAPAGMLSTTSMAPQQVRAIVADSCAVLDIEHPRQRGLTMRTIETLLAQKKLITTNRHILDCDLCDPSRVLLISRDDPQLDPAFLATPFAPIPETLRASYSCEGWATELLRQQERARAAKRAMAVPAVSDEAPHGRH